MRLEEERVRWYEEYEKALKRAREEREREMEEEEESEEEESEEEEETERVSVRGGRVVGRPGGLSGGGSWARPDGSRSSRRRSPWSS